MATLSLRKRDGSVSQLERTLIEFALSGQLIYPDSDSYDKSREIWNAMIDRRPGLMIRAQVEEDISAAVNFSRDHDLLFAVKAGGHNIAGKALVDGGLVIDLREMNKVDVDAKALVARVHPGATLGDVDRATQVYGLVVPTGINSTTGIAGLTLGGGFGWTARKHGLTIDSLRAVKIVTASGNVLKVDRDTHPDLFWAIRGAGGNFGIVIEFEFDLHEAGPEVLAGMVVYPFSAMMDVVEQYQSALKHAPDELTCWVVLRKAPPLPFLPEEWHGKEVAVLAMCYVGNIAEGEAATARFRGIGDPIADVVAPMPFVDWQAAFDPLLTPGARNYWKSHDLASFSSDALEVIRGAVSNLPTGECEVFFGHIGGAATRVSSSETAWPNREAHFVVNVHTRWRDPADDKRCIEWARRLHRQLEPHALGSIYVNFIPEGDDDQVMNAYGSNFERLLSIKQSVDPGNLFQGLQNINPATGAAHGQ